MPEEIIAIAQTQEPNSVSGALQVAKDVDAFANEKAKFVFEISEIDKGFIVQAHYQKPLQPPSSRRNYVANDIDEAVDLIKTIYATPV